MLLRIKSVCVCKILGFSGSSTTTLTLATFPSILGFVRKVLISLSLCTCLCVYLALGRLCASFSVYLFFFLCFDAIVDQGCGFSVFG